MNLRSILEPFKPPKRGNIDQIGTHRKSTARETTGRFWDSIRTDGSESAVNEFAVHFRAIQTSKARKNRSDRNSRKKHSSRHYWPILGLYTNGWVGLGCK